jgi:hypothetical protein
VYTSSHKFVQSTTKKRAESTISHGVEIGLTQSLQIEASHMPEKNIETRWTDDIIRWPDDPPKTTHASEEEEEETGYMDPFKDPDPFQIFPFQFERPQTESGHTNNEESHIDLKIRGYKEEADEIWKSTGLTLWRASDYLCEYQVKHATLFQGKRVLEVSVVDALQFWVSHTL